MNFFKECVIFNIYRYYLPKNGKTAIQNVEISMKILFHHIFPHLNGFSMYKPLAYKYIFIHYCAFRSDDSCNMPLFLPPPLFAKFNSSKENKLFYERYKYYEKVIPEVAERLKKDSRKKQELKNAIDRTRAIRKVNSIFVNFNSKDASIPQAPREGALNAIRKRGLDAGSLKKVQQVSNCEVSTFIMVFIS